MDGSVAKEGVGSEQRRAAQHKGIWDPGPHKRCHLGWHLVSSNPIDVIGHVALCRIGSSFAINVCLGTAWQCIRSGHIPVSMG